MAFRWNRASQSYLPVLVAIGVCVLLMVYVGAYPWSGGASARPKRGPMTAPGARTDAASFRSWNHWHEDVVVVYIAVGYELMCKTHQLETALFTLAYYGAWAGDVHVLTDYPECFNATMFYDVLPRIAAVPRVSLIGVPEETDAMHIKAWKTRPFFEDRGRHVHALYLDIDVLVGNFIEPFLDYALPALARASGDNRVRSDTPVGSIGAFCVPRDKASNKLAEDAGIQLLGTQRDACHSGVVLSSTGTSEPCFASWQLKMQYVRRDQEALEAADNGAACTVARLSPLPWILFPDVSSLEALVADVTSGEFTFAHITRALRAKIIERNRWNNVLLDQFHIPDELRGPKIVQGLV